MLKKYELMVILSPNLNEEEHAALVQKLEDSIKKHGGSDITKDIWGMRDLAYKINKGSKGYYVLFKFTSTGRDNKIIESDMNIDENIYRYLIIKDESEKLVKKIKARDEARAAKRASGESKPPRENRTRRYERKLPRREYSPSAEKKEDTKE